MKNLLSSLDEHVVGIVLSVSAYMLTKSVLEGSELKFLKWNEMTTKVNKQPK